MPSSTSKAEKSYIQAGLLSTPPLRLDARSLFDFRAIALETGVSPLANGSARLSIAGTEVLAAAKLQVEETEFDGRLVCTVSCAPSAYPSLSSAALDDLQSDMTSILHQTLSDSSLHPPNLGILPLKKAWLLNLDVLVLSDAGNVYDAIFIAAKAALSDTRVPRTKSVEYKAKKSGHSTSAASVGATATNMDVDEDTPSGFDTRQIANAIDFELPDYWDEGEVLVNRDHWPVSITLNIVQPMSYLDATTQEEASTDLRFLTVFSFPSSSPPRLQGMRLIGPGELKLEEIQTLIKDGEKHARQLSAALDVKLQEEDLRRNQKARERFTNR